MALTVEDKFLITEKIHRLCQHLDAQEVDAAIAHLTPDFTLVAPERTIDRDEYRRMIESAELEVPSQHWAGNIVIDGEGDRAEARTYVFCPEGPHADGSFGVLLFGTNDYSAIRVEGEWMFERFTIRREKTYEALKQA